MAWRNCYAGDVKRAEINTRWPGRDRRSDGTIGDAAHATRQSDHNPWLQHGGLGIVRADDIDVDGIDAAWYAEHVRLLGANGDRRLNPGGYVIFNRRIAGGWTGWRWHAYTGTNPHTSHVHTSYSSKVDDFDLRHPWGISSAAAAPPAARRLVTEDQTMHVTTPPATGADKRTWPAQRISFGFDPTGGWGGRCVLNLHFGFPGGWVHEAKWWVRGGTGVGQENAPHSPEAVNYRDTGGQERHGGMGWQLTPPARADELEILCSAPGGVHIFPIYER